MNSKPHTLRVFDQVLERLSKSALKAFSSTYLAMQFSHKALFTRDSDLANEIIAEDDKIDELNKSISHQSMNILASFAPVSTDLRYVLCLASVSRHLERIGDQCVTISRHVLKLNDLSELREARLLEPGFQSVLSQASKTRTNLESPEFDSIRSDLQNQNELTESIASVTEQLARISEQGSVSIPALAELIFISRSLENISALLGDINEEILTIPPALSPDPDSQE